MTQPARILLIHDRGARGGTERHVEWLAVGLAERGWKVTVAVSHGGPGLASVREKGIPCEIIRRRFRVDPFYVLGVARLARRLHAEIVHAHSGRVAVLGGRVAGAPVLIETRHGLTIPTGPGVPLRLRLEARICRVADRTVTVCRSDRSRLLAAGLAEERVVHIPNGIPSKAAELKASRTAGASQGRLRLGFVGRLAPEKNPLFLVDLARLLEAEMASSWELTVAGDGPLMQRLARGLGPYAEKGKVSLLGETDGPAALFERADILLVPSRREGQPLGVLEAMQAGVLVVATKLPSLEELLAGEPPAGLLLPEEPAVWAKELASLAGEAERRERLTTEAARRADSGHSLEKMLTALESLYREAFAEAGRGC